MTPEHQLLVNVQAAAKSKNPAAGVAAYHAAVAVGIKIQPDLYSTLLYLCSGGDAWELPLRQQLTESTALVEDIIQQAAADVAAQQEEDAAAGADQQAALVSPASSRTTAVGEPIALAQTALPSAAPNENGHATAVAPPSVAGSKSPVAGAIVNSAGGVMPAAVAGSASHALPGRSDSLPQLTPSQLRQEGRAIFDHMQVKTVLGAFGVYMCLSGIEPASVLMLATTYQTCDAVVDISEKAAQS